MYKFAQALRRMRNEERDFTLVELMVVVVIIGVLAAVAIPKFAGIIDNSKVKADVATGKTIKDAVDRYYTEKGSYPVTANDASATSATLVTGAYLSAAPKYAQIAGGTDSTTFNKIFEVTTSGQVNVWRVDKTGAHVDANGAATTTPEWSSGS